MSVINQMLRDLEDRKRQEADHAAHGLMPSNQQKARGNGSKVVWFVIVGLLIILLSMWGLFKAGHVSVPVMVNSLMNMPSPETQMKQKSVPAVAKKVISTPRRPITTEYAPPPPPLVVPKSPPMVMEAIDWKINKQAMAMSFRLPTKVNYEVVVDEKKNVVTLTFPHTVFDSSKPLILLENEFADKVEKIQEGDFLQVKAYLKPNTAVAYVDYSPDAKMPTLVMSLSRSIPHDYR